MALVSFALGWLFGDSFGDVEPSVFEYSENIGGGGRKPSTPAPDTFSPTSEGVRTRFPQ